MLERGRAVAGGGDRRAARRGRTRDWSRALSGAAVALLLVFGATRTGLGQPATGASAPRLDLKLSGPSTVTAGEPVPLSVTLAPARGLVLPRASRWVVELASEPGGVLVLPRASYGRADAADPDAESPRIAVRGRAATAGAAVVRGTFRGWVCSSRVCFPVEQTAALPIAIVASAAAGDAGGPLDAGRSPP